MNTTRRNFIKLLGITSASSIVGLLQPSSFAFANSGGRVVVIGGGFGGATCANYLKKYDPSLDVTIIEPKKKYITCPFSNTVLGGFNSIKNITFDYNKLINKQKIKLIYDTVKEIDMAGHSLTTNTGKRVKYDKLVVAPGISFYWDQIEGYSESLIDTIPHAWQAGSQTLLLKKQLESMRDGGVFIIAVPPKPFRAPPAPYERASLIAHYFSKNKPKSKIIIIDSSKDFFEQKLFEQGWKKLYPGMINWVKGEEKGHVVASIDPKKMTIITQSGESYKGDVINLVPTQKAGNIAHTAGLTNKSGWCEINHKTFQSSLDKDVYVIGDACIAEPMPKAGFAASVQAKICAAAIVQELKGEPMPDPIYINTFYSFIGPKYAISDAEVYRLKDGKIKMIAGEASPLKASKRFRKKEANYAKGWYSAITAEAFAG